MNNKEKIMSRTLKMMGLVEYSEITMEDIAEYSFVSKMTLYNNFENKHTLRVKSMMYLYSQEMERAFQILNSERPFREKVTDIIKEKIKKYDEKYLRMFRTFDIYDIDFQAFLKSQYENDAIEFRKSFYHGARNHLVNHIDENQFWEYIEVMSSGFAHLHKKGINIAKLEENQTFNTMMNAILNS